MMSITAQRFKAEWEYFQKSKNLKSVEKVLELVKDKKTYARENISRFKNGSKKLEDEDFEIFSNLFGVRKDYLAGISPYRTNMDETIEIQKRKNIRTSFRQILVALGYADLEMETEDFNFTFPSNTRGFIEFLKESEINDKVICDVNKDDYIIIDNDSYELLMHEIIEFIEFKISKFFAFAERIPDVVTEDGNPLLRPYGNIIHYKDGSSTDARIKYTPTANLTREALLDMFELIDL